MKRLSFRVNSFRKIPNPFAETYGSSFQNVDSYVMVVDVKNIPTDIPKETNPREQKLTTAVARSIEYSLMRPAEDNFLLLNRGLLVSARDVDYDSKSQTVSLTFVDPKVHGNIDGGHTYEIIKKNMDNLNHNEQFVKLEVVTGIEDFFQDLARARNTSTQVKDKSIAELEQKFDIIKKALPNEVLDRVSFKENEEGNIDIVDLLATLNLFDLEKYPRDQFINFPIVSYSGKAQCIKYYLDYYKNHRETARNPYVKMSKIMADILKLYDYIEKNMRIYYKETVGKKYGAVKGIVNRASHSTFFEEEIDYITPKSFVFPILASLRCLVKEDKFTHEYRWERDPFEFLDFNGGALVDILIASHRELGNNPNSTGKSKNLWHTLFLTSTMKKTSVN